MTTVNRPDAVLDLPLFTYFTIPAEMKGIIPGWLWKKKMVSSNTQGKPKPVKTTKLFDGKVVDLYTLADDLTKKGIVPCYIHHQARNNGSYRIRVDWEKGKDPLPREEVLWILHVLLERFCWDSQSHRTPEPTEFLPAHLNISNGNPVEKSSATCVLSVQLLKGALALINDPDAAQEESNRSRRKAKVEA